MFWRAQEAEVLVVDLLLIEDFDELIIFTDLGRAISSTWVVFFVRRNRVARSTPIHYSLFNIIITLFQLMLGTIEHLSKYAPKAPHVTALVIVVVTDDNLRRSIPPWYDSRWDVSFLFKPCLPLVFELLANPTSEQLKVQLPLSLILRFQYRLVFILPHLFEFLLLRG